MTNFYKIFFEDNFLITFLTIINLNRDLQSLILDMLINDIMDEEFSIHDYYDVTGEDMLDYYFSE